MSRSRSPTSSPSSPSSARRGRREVLEPEPVRVSSPGRPPESAAAATPAELRLVGGGGSSTALTLRFTRVEPQSSPGADAPASGRAVSGDGAGLKPADPRWVLAVRTQQLLQGAVLRPADRQDLLGVGRLLGLNPFDANLVIAIVQDQARRGGDLGGAAASLRRVPVRPGRERTGLGWRVAAWCAAVLAAELVIVWIII